MIDKILEVGGNKMLLPFVVAMATSALIKALFHWNRSRSSDRREFLELWSRSQEKDDLWLEVAIRHLYGTYLPAAVIRLLMQSPQAARAILEVSQFWDLLEMNDKTLEIDWKKPTHSKSRIRKRNARLMVLAYFVCMSLAVICVFFALGIRMNVLMTICLYFFAVFLAFIAFRSLDEDEKWKLADSGAPRWLGLR